MQDRTALALENIHGSIAVLEQIGQRPAARRFGGDRERAGEGVVARRVALFDSPSALAPHLANCFARVRA